MKKIFFAITLCILGFFSQNILAQETQVYTTNLKWYNEGLELLEKEKYSAAINAFEKTQHTILDKNSEVYVNATYYKALCALNLFNKDAEFQLKEFVKNYPESPQVKLSLIHI